MTTTKSGVNAGLKAGLIIGIINAILTPILIWYFVDQYFTTPLSSFANTMIMSTVASSIFRAIISGLISGAIFGFIYGKIYDKLPGSTSVTKGMSLGFVYWLLFSVILGRVLLSGYGENYYQINMYLGFIIYLFFGFLVGKFWDKEGGTERKCHNCGRSIPYDSRACPYCGRPSEKDTATISPIYMSERKRNPVAMILAIVFIIFILIAVFQTLFVYFSWDIGSSPTRDNPFLDGNEEQNVSTIYHVLYVGGTGPNNYSTIQAAINNASTGETVFVYKGTYYERVVIDKSIHLIGEDRKTTFISANKTSNVISINNYLHNVEIAQFTLFNAYPNVIGVGSYTKGTLIRNNTLSQGYKGISCWNIGNDITIKGNIISDNYIGIELGADTALIDHNNFINNTIQACGTGSHNWDNGYPSGGNYWDDYTGVDNDGDSIGDTPYIIIEGSHQDRYPLMNPIDI